MTAIPPVRQRRVIAENRYVRYVEEDLRPKPGGGSYTYYFLETTQPAVIVVPLFDDGRLLLERVYRHPHRAWMLEFPAGGIDEGESALEAAARELREETGHVAQAYELLGRIWPLAGLVSVEVDVVLAHGVQPQHELAHEAMELIELTSMSRDEAEARSIDEPSSGILLFGLHHLAQWQRRQGTGQ